MASKENSQEDKTMILAFKNKNAGIENEIMRIEGVQAFKALENFKRQGVIREVPKKAGSDATVCYRFNDTLTWEIMPFAEFTLWKEWTVLVVTL
jgi:hypothetical protein